MSELLKKQDTGWVLWGISSLFYLYANIVRYLIPAISPEVVPLFKVNLTEIGLLTSTFFYVTSIGLIISGFLVEKYQLRIILLTAILLTFIGSLIFALSEEFLMLEIGRAICGLATAASFILATKISSRYLDKNNASLAVGLTFFVGTIGILVAEAPLSAVANVYGFKVTSVGISLLALAILILTFMLFRIKSEPDQPSVQKTNLLLSLKELFKDRNYLIVFGYALFVASVFFAFFGAWGAIYLKKSLQISNVKAQSFMSLAVIGFAIGSPLVSLMSNYFKQRKIFLTVLAFFQLFSISLILFIKNPSHELISVLLFLFGVSLSSFSLSITCAKETVKANYVGIAVAILAAGTQLTGGLLQNTIGYLLSHLSSEKFSYLVFEESFSPMMSFILFAFLISFFFKETYNKSA